MSKTLIRNARMVNEGQISEGDILIENDRIARIDREISAPPNAEIYDAQGHLVMPGMIDDQVHFREPGLTHKGDIASESRAAVAGGVTSFMDMPNTNPPTLDAQRLQAKYASARDRSPANYGFYMGASNDNLEDVARIDPLTTPGVKVFMGASTGNMLVDDPQTLEGIFSSAPVPIITHCEDTPTIEANLKAAEARFPDGIPISEHPHIRSEEACFRSSSLAVDLARRFGSQLHVLHLTTAKELSLFSKGPVKDKQITVEVCVHHLTFDESDYQRLGSFIQCNPAIKTERDRKALVKALADDVIDVVATDHAPHTLEEKERPYPASAAGLPLVQHVVQAVLELVDQGHLSLPQAVNKMTHAVAERFSVKERGYLREGYFADITVVDMDQPYPVSRDNVLYRCGWSPFEGRTFKSSILTTFVNGTKVWDQGSLSEKTPGVRLTFSR